MVVWVKVVVGEIVMGEVEKVDWVITESEARSVVNVESRDFLFVNAESGHPSVCHRLEMFRDSSIIILP